MRVAGCKVLDRCGLCVAVAAFGVLAVTGVTPARAQPQPTELPLDTNEKFVDGVLHPPALDISDKKAVFAYVLNKLPERVKVYPTENYYYFKFVYGGAAYGGNIRFENDLRDQGKLHFAYGMEFSDWAPPGDVFHVLFTREDGVELERINDLTYRVTFGAKSVVFELNDLSKVVPPPNLLAPDERYIGPIFDESAVRFFLVYNSKLRQFLYLLDETVPSTDLLGRARVSDRILVGQRTGFAYYLDHKIDRKILVGVYEGNVRVNNFFDGPFDQLPDNFLEGDVLRNAILEVQPDLAGKIDRFGSSPDGETRFMIAPYLQYNAVEELGVFHRCATNRAIPQDLYYACFMIDEDASEQQRKPVTVAESKARPRSNQAPRQGGGRRKQ